VGNLSFDVTREELIQAFSAAGKVVDAKVPTDRETGRPRGFAFVEFESDDAAQKSIGMLNGKDLKGRPLRVNEAENRPPRPPGSAPSGGGFRPSSGGPGGFRPSGGGGGGGSYRGGGPPSMFPPPGVEFDARPAEGRGRRFKTKAAPKKNNQRRRKDDVAEDDD
jgi:cold-inducible RNA-binding protein